jgi:hypothetical protein
MVGLLKNCSKKVEKTVDFDSLLCKINATHGDNRNKLKNKNMRTKVLLAAAVLAAGLATSMAQNVYSVNVVGYVNQVYTAGQFAIIANPLNTTNNTVAAIMQNPKNGMIVYKFVGGSMQANNYLGGAWTTPASTLNPGEGAFLYVPAGSNYTNTYVGEVLTGNLTNSLPTGFALVGSKVPQQGALQADMSYPVVNGTIVYKWVNPSLSAYNYLGGSWAPSDPVMNVAEGWFSYKPAAVDWVRNFTIP